MSLGPGKYDEFATALRESTRARGVIIIVMEGALGSGFSVQLPSTDHEHLPALLRHMAHEIETDKP